MTDTKPKTPYHKLQTNIPIVGKVMAAYYAEGTYGPQVKLLGEWDGLGKGYVALNIALENELRSIGLIQVSEKDGKPSYQVAYKGRISLTRKEDGTRKYTVVEREDGQGSGSGAPTAPVAPAIAKATEAPTTDRSAWLALRETYRSCRAIAVEEWPEHTPPEVIQAAAATIFIQACKVGMLVYPKESGKVVAQQIAAATAPNYPNTDPPPYEPDEDRDALPF